MTPRWDLPRLCVILDCPRDEPPLELCRKVAAARPPMIQIRVKLPSDRLAWECAEAMFHEVRAGSPATVVVVNDRPDMAVALGADGVHVGADDLPVDAVRRVVGPHMIVGATARNPDEARDARRRGADYLGVGPVWPTSTKSGLPAPIGVDGLSRTCRAVDLPVLAISGVTLERVPQALAAGAHGVAVVSAVAAAADPARAVEDLMGVLESHSGVTGTTGASRHPDT
ncbi:MAG: thiamine-phosphate synthase [Acidimicrobiales bacterium]|nr:MAG: thiamine-phosphate synthase [Acidimicrobiales bacterium]